MFDFRRSVFCLFNLIYAIICLTDILNLYVVKFIQFVFKLLDFMPCFHGIPYSKIMLILSFSTATFLVIMDESSVLQYTVYMKKEKLICIF